MNTKLAIGVLLTLVAVTGLASPVSAEAPPIDNSSKDCARINEDGTVHTDIPACRRFIQNITDVAP